MGIPYSITVLFGLAFAGVVLLVFAHESGKENLAPKIGCGVVFIAAAVVLWFLVAEIVSP
jgi:hypothetical protein